MTGIIGKTIAVLGAGGHIGKNLALYLGAVGKCQLVLFSRSPQKMADFVQLEAPGAQALCVGYECFHEHQYDAVVNCVGLGNPTEIIAAGAAIFRLTEQYDNLVLDYISRRPGCAYVYLSSGAVYGQEFSEPASDKSQVLLPVNKIKPEEYYGLAKLNAEAKHRAFHELKIVDLRIFGFFSRYVDPAAGFLLTDVVKAIRTRSVLVTSAVDIVRDYVHPKDLATLIGLCISATYGNTAYDVYSAAPVHKFTLLSECSSRFGLKLQVQSAAVGGTATGQKVNYYSVSHRAGERGYVPRHTALDTVVSELAEMV